MIWYDNKTGRIIYGPATTRAIFWSYGIDYGDGCTYFADNQSGDCWSPLKWAMILENNNLMTNEIRKELEDYIFVNV